MHGAPSTARDIATSKMAAVIPANAKGTNKGRFCRAKAFIRNTAADGLTASRSAIDKQGNEKKMCVIPKSAVVLHFAAFELWNSILKCPG